MGTDESTPSMVSYSISSKNKIYKDQIVLVEHRDKSQYNHWELKCNTKECKYHPTITQNGDDDKGKLKCKAPRLQIIE